MKKNIDLPNGLSLEVFVTQEFLQKVRESFDLDHNQEVQDHHIKNFIYSAVDNAVEKAEKNLNNTTLK